MHSASGHFIAILGKSKIPILVGHFTTTLPVLVVQNFKYDVLLGNDTFLRLRCSLDFNNLILKSPYAFSFRMYSATQMQHSTARFVARLPYRPGLQLAPWRYVMK